MRRHERFAIFLGLAGVGLAVVLATGCGSVKALTDDAGHDAGAAGAGGMPGDGAAGGNAGGAGTSAAGAPGGGTSGAAGAGVGGSAGAGGSVDVDAGARPCGAPVRNVGVSCSSKAGPGLACATCVGVADSSPRYDCRGSISGSPVYCFPAGVPSDVAGCESCP